MAPQRLQLTWYNKDKALIPTETGKYGYMWVDPADPRCCETHTLIYDGFVPGTQTPTSAGNTYSERAYLEPQDDNLLICGESGNVLEALTRVPELATKYLGNIKLIYIDPPFNTAQTFTHYEDNLEHSIWLTMMRDRLVHLKRLLTDDGSIWIHLDDVENHRMRVLLDEIFGPTRFYAEISVEINPKGRQLGNSLARTQDSIIVYSKQPGAVLNVGDRNLVNPRDFPHSTAEGVPYRYLPLRNSNTKFNPHTAPTMFYPLYGDATSGRVATSSFPGSTEIVPVFGDGTPAVWRWSPQKVDALHADLQARVVRGRRGQRLDVFQKDYAGPDRTKKFKNLWRAADVGSTDTALQEIKNLHPQLAPFATPKPERLLERIIHIGSDPGDIVLDVFAGSGTTAAVAQKMGRRWVTCELLESTFTTFTKPRLEKVVNDKDPGGVTRTKGKRVAAENVTLPEGVTAEDAATFTAVLNKLIATDPEAKTSRWAKTLKAATKTTRTNDVINWRGGGGFHMAHLSPACFDYSPELDRVMLTPAATGKTLIQSIAANLGFHLLSREEGYIFHGRRGATFLKVIEEPATTHLIDSLVAHLEPGQSMLLAATTVLDGARQHLRRVSTGSRLIAIPDDIFRYNLEGTQQ